MWTHHESFKGLVYRQWQQIHHPSPLADVSIKLKLLRLELKKWNLSTFGNIFTQKNELDADISRLEESLQAHWCPTSHAQLLECKAKWREIAIRDEIFWKQKSRIKWLLEGDSNSQFFHGIGRSKAALARIDSLIGPNEVVLQGHEAIHEASVEFFAKLFTSEPHQLKEELLDLIPSKISLETNAMLMFPFSMEELHSAAAAIPIDSAVGIDGFSASFFTSMWDIIGPSILAAANEFLITKSLPLAVSHSILILILKKQIINSFNDFRPISLCTTLYKIIAKAICARLATILPTLISPNQ